jgi:integrase
MRKRKSRDGLRWRNGVWNIETRCKYTESRWLRKSTQLTEFDEAKAYKDRLVASLTRKYERRLQGIYKFEEAGLKYLSEIAHLSSADDIALHLDNLFPFIGNLDLESVHDGTLAPYIEHETNRGLAPKSINIALGVASTVLRRASMVWRDGNGRPWLKQAPPRITRIPIRGRQAKPYSLTWQEQDRLIQALPRHLQDMVLFKVNTGTREQEVCQLRWDWEVKVPEIKISVFIIPAFIDGAQRVKNGEDRLVVLNSIASNIIESRRGKHDEYVFTYKAGKDAEEMPITRINNTAWRSAWKDAGLPVSKDIRRGVHNLKHTVGRRLRAVGCPMETRKVLLGHKDGDITTHYSAAELEELLYWMEKLTERGAIQTPTLTVLKRHNVG